MTEYSIKKIAKRHMRSIVARGKKCAGGRNWRKGRMFKKFQKSRECYMYVYMGEARP